MIVDAFNGQIYEPNKMDVQHTPIYDTVTIAAAGALNVTTSSFFTNVGPASGKTLGLTNMSQGNRLPAPEAFSIFGFRLRWSENILLADLYTLLNTQALAFSLGQKRYQLGPLWHYAAGGGIGGFSTNTTESVYTNGLVGRDSMHKLAIPIVIENQMNFEAHLEGATATLTAAASGGTGAILQLLLDGLYARGVQ